MDKGEEFAVGRFFSFPMEDNVPEISADGMTVLHDFISRSTPSDAHPRGEKLFTRFIVWSCLDTICGELTFLEFLCGE